jgi:hypothetical protein
LWCHENRLFLSGGKGRFGGSKYDTNGQDTWMYDVDRKVWTELNTQEGATLPPQAGGGISNTPSALDAASGDFFVVYRSWRSFYTSIWRFNATSYTWSKAADLVVNAMNLRETSSILDTVAFESETSELSFLFRTRTLSRRYAYNVGTVYSLAAATLRFLFEIICISYWLTHLRGPSRISSLSPGFIICSCCAFNWQWPHFADRTERSVEPDLVSRSTGHSNLG